MLSTNLLTVNDLDAADVGISRRRFVCFSAAMILSGCKGGRWIDDSSVNDGENILSEATFRRSNVGNGWARTSANAPIFRKDSLSSTPTFQYIAYYGELGEVLIGKRVLHTNHWELTRTGFYGHPEDAHNSISLMVDDNGFLHLAWDHHVDALKYARTLVPGTMDFAAPEPMIGEDEEEVTYPEFHAYPSGDLLFAYRCGRSGDGRLILNHYSLATARWSRVQSNLLDGEGERNAYWQIYIDASSRIHLSWIWRESSDVSTNHDICYAYSDTGGRTWSDVTAQALAVPVTVRNNKPVWLVEAGSNLINQTSMAAAPDGSPYIVTYFRIDPKHTNIQLLYFDREYLRWKLETVTDRATDFELGGKGTKSLPISRPIVIVEPRQDNQHCVHVIYRDEEFYDQAVHAYSLRGQLGNGFGWKRKVIPAGSLDRWEPSFDSKLWQSQQRLHLYVQRVGQIDQEQVADNYPATEVSVVELDLE